MTHRQSRLTSAKTRNNEAKSRLLMEADLNTDFTSPVTLCEKHMKEFRIPQPNVYNYLKNTINKTFALNSNPVYKNIKELVDCKVQPQHTKKLDNLLLKYSIAVNPRKRRMANADVDVEFITKSYVRSRSRQKKKEQNNKRLKAEVQKYYYTNQHSQKCQPKSFFTFNGDSIRNLQKHAKQEKLDKSKSLTLEEDRNTPKAQDCTNKAKTTKATFSFLGSSRVGSALSQRSSPRKRATSARACYKHPYMTIYEELQDQTFRNMGSGRKLQIENGCPELVEPEQWQVEQKKVKSVYSGVERMRQIQSAKERKRGKSSGQNYNFYIT